MTMKLKFVDDIRDLIKESRNWLELEIEYAKLTFAEKLTMLLSTLIIGFICLLLGLVVLVMLAFVIAEFFKVIMCPALAYLASAGCGLLLLLLLYFFRRPILLNPIAKMLTRIFFDKKH